MSQHRGWQSKRRTLFLMMFAVLMLLALLIYQRPHNIEQPEETVVADTQPARIPVVEPALPSGTADTDQRETVPETPERQTTERAQSQELPAVFSLHTPIEFYGKVVDESGLPISGVQVQIGRLDASPGNYTKTTVETDSEGLFSLSGVTGKALDIALEKEGYYYSRRTNPTSFEYSNPGADNFHRPNPHAPVIFHLRKKGEGVELITSQYGVRSALSFQAPTNGLPVRVDFASRKIDPRGPLQLETWKGAKEATTGKNNWGFRLTLHEGGLVAHDDDFPFEAPESGYEQSFEWYSAADGTNWQGRLRKRFYVKFGSPPRYGRLEIETPALSPVVYLEYAVNPDGSRNLEPK
jgi:hypothetical protein